MSSSASPAAAGISAHAGVPGRSGSHELFWSAIFAAPYVVVFLLFVIYPVCYGLWMGSDPASYRTLFSDPIYVRTVLNTLLLLVVGVNLKMILSLLLAEFFIVGRPWMRALFLVFILPWAVPAIPEFISIHWMLDAQWGFINNFLWNVFGIMGPPWLARPDLAMGSVVVAYIWKWLPFWTLIFLAGRMAIPRDLYEAASVDGATGVKAFVHITIPMMWKLYVTCTLLSTLWTLGDYNTVHFVSGGGPVLSTHVLATLGIRDAFEIGDPSLGVAVVITALPLVIPIMVLLMRQFRRDQVSG
jgi:multiple sugar transport system permease protein